MVNSCIKLLFEHQCSRILLWKLWVGDQIVNGSARDQRTEALSLLVGRFLHKQHLGTVLPNYSKK